METRSRDGLATIRELRDAAPRSLDPLKGRGMLIALRSGAVYVMDSKGNRRGQWIREH